MKSTLIVAFTAFLVLTGCQNYDSDMNSLTRRDVLIADFKSSGAYMDFLQWGIHLNLDEAELVEITHFEYLFISASEESGRSQTYVIKLIPELDWTHFLRIEADGKINDMEKYTGKVVFDFYTEGSKSIHNFENGVQTEFQVFASGNNAMRRSLMGRIASTEECESMCHVLDCAGRKFEDKHWVSKIQCASNIMPCMASLAIQCLDEGCANSWVKSCDYH